MKVVVLAGGLGTRLAEETEVRPKPMVEIGGHPILWHIMKHYAHYRYPEFFIALGYKGEVIKRYFLDYYALNGSMTVALKRGNVRVIDSNHEDWTVHLMDTGNETNTGGRVKRLEPWLREGAFMLTYGDGVSNIDLHDLLRFHRAHGRIATVTAVRPPARFGGLVFDGDLISEFTEKPQIGEGWINGGFMIFEPAVFDYLDGDDTSLEAHALERLASERQLAAYRHEGFWQCMDTLREKRLLESHWQSGQAPWRVWE
jgi:glucose-1-phosphate cytidylyltransferase